MTNVKHLDYWITQDRVKAIANKAKLHQVLKSLKIEKKPVNSWEQLIFAEKCRVVTPIL